MPELLFIFLIGIFLLFISGGIHKVSEGYIGLYWRGGALMSGYSEPGFQLMMPFVTSWEQVQVTVETDLVEDIPCGTAGGVMIYFDKIEVVNRLNKDLAWETIKNYTVNYDKTWIFDKIHHEINQFCSKHTLQEVYISEFDNLDENLVRELQIGCDKWAPGIEIIAVRVTKPRIPENIMNNYIKMESEKTNYLIATERQKVTEKESETKRKKEIIVAQGEAEVSKITKEMEINEHKAKKKIEEIENLIYLDKQKSYTDADFYKISKEIDANNHKFSSDYLRYVTFVNLSNTTKTYFGPSIPDFLDKNVLSLAK